MPSLPIEVNVSDLLPNKRNKTMSARADTFMFYPLLSAEDIIMGIRTTSRSY